MQLHSASAKHKLAIAALLMLLFALPFALQWRAVNAFDSKALMAGGAVVGNNAFTKQKPSPNTNHAAHISQVTGGSFTGAVAQSR